MRQQLARGVDRGLAVGSNRQMAAVVEHDVGGQAALMIAVDSAYQALGNAIGRWLAPV